MVLLNRCGWTLRLGSLDASHAPGSARFRAQRALTPYTGACSLSALQRHTEYMGTPMQDGVRLSTPTSESAYRGLETIQVLDTGEMQVVDAAKLRVAAASEPHDSR